MHSFGACCDSLFSLPGASLARSARVRKIAALVVVTMLVLTIPIPRLALAADDNVPGTPLTASPIVGAVDPDTDPHDVYSIYLTAGSRLMLELTPAAADADLELRLFKPGTPTIADDTWVAAVGEWAAPNKDVIWYTAEATGTYYVDAGVTYVGGGSYTLTWRSVAKMPDDDVPGTTLPASPVNGALEHFWDVDDVYSIYLTAGSRLTLELAPASASVDLQLRLFKPGTPSVSADEYTWLAAAGVSADPNKKVIQYTAEQTGMYYIDLRTAREQSGAYTLTWRSVAQGPDDEVPGVALPASPVSGTLDTFWDPHDVYAIHLTAGSRLMAVLTSSDGGDFDFELFKPGTPTVTTDDSSWQAAWGQWFYPDYKVMTYTAATTGTYYVHVEATLSSGSYDFSWETAPFTADDALPGQPLPASPVACAVQPVLDTHDLYCVTVPDHTWIRLRLTGRPGRNTDLRLLKPGCPAIPTAWDDPWIAAYSESEGSTESIDYLASTGGTYYVDVKPSDYTLSPWEEPWDNCTLTWRTPPDINIDVSPFHAPLGQVVVGQTKTLNVPVKNIGTLPLHLTGAAVAPSASGLSVSANPAPVTVPPGGSTSVQLSWSPPSAGALSTFLVLSSDDPDDPVLRVPVLGRAVTAVTATAFTFGQSRICASLAFDRYDAVIDGDNILWTDTRNKMLVPWGEGRFVYIGIGVYHQRLPDISTVGTEISSIGDQGTASSPDVSGNRAVWYQDFAFALNSNKGVIYDIAAGRTVDVIDGADEIRISGNTVAYQIDGSLYVRDLISGKTAGPLLENCSGIAFDGDRIAYERSNDAPDGEWQSDVWVYDLGTGQNRVLAGAPTYSESQPAVSGNLVVWTDERSGIGQIYVHDLSSGVTRPVSPSTGRQSGPKVDGNRIVWVDTRNSAEGDIYLYDLSLQSDYRVTGNVARPDCPDVSGDRIVWSGDARDVMWLSTVRGSVANNPPVLAFIGDKTVNELSQLSFTATASDADLPADKLVFSLAPGAPSGAVITSSGAFTWIPSEVQGPGSYPITIVVTDEHGATDTETIKVTVAEVPEAPPTGLATSPLTASSVSLSWTRAASTSGVTGYRVERASSAAGTFAKVADVTTPYYANTGLVANTTYYYRVRALKGTAVSAPSAVVSAKTLAISSVTVQQDVTGPTWTGTWTTASGSSFSGASTKRTTVAGAKVTVPFRGSSVKWIGTKGTAYGKANVDLDGVRVATGVNLYASTQVFQATLFTRSGLADKAHTLTITCAVGGKRVDVDAFGVTGLSPGVNREQTAGTYVGTWATPTNSVYSGGTARTSTSSAALVTFTFKGTSVTWLGTRAVSRGKAKVYVDNVYLGTVDQFAATTVNQAVVWRKSGLANATHTFKIVPAATRNPAATSNTVEVDAVIVR